MVDATSISVEALYERAGIIPTGVITWGKDAWDKQALPQSSGVYVISVEDTSSIPFLEPFESKERILWKADQHVVYIGRARNLSRRLRQFRRHRYGDSSPHRGGQAILLLNCPKIVRFAETSDYVRAEDKLIEAFEAHAGRMPFGNRVRASMGKTIVEAVGNGASA